MTKKVPKLAAELAQILEQSSGTVSMSFYFSVHCIKRIDCMLPCVCSVIDQRRRQNVVKTFSGQ